MSTEPPTGPECTCIMLAAQTPWQPAEWEQADDCPVHPLPGPLDRPAG